MSSFVRRQLISISKSDNPYQSIPHITQNSYQKIKTIQEFYSETFLQIQREVDYILIQNSEKDFWLTRVSCLITSWSHFHPKGLQRKYP